MRFRPPRLRPSPSAAGVLATRGSNGSGVIDQVINTDWGAEPPSPDPGLATDTTSGD